MMENALVHAALLQASVSLQLNLLLFFFLVDSLGLLAFLLVSHGEKKRRLRANIMLKSTIPIDLYKFHIIYLIRMSAISVGAYSINMPNTSRTPPKSTGMATVIQF